MSKRVNSQDSVSFSYVDVEELTEIDSSCLTYKQFFEKISSLCDGETSKGIPFTTNTLEQYIQVRSLPMRLGGNLIEVVKYLDEKYFRILPIRKERKKPVIKKKLFI